MTEAADSYGRHAYPVQEAVVKYTTEPKVKFSTAAGASAAGLVTPVLIRIADDLFLDGDGPATVPIEYVGLLSAVVVAACSWAAGYWAPHVERNQPPDAQ